MPRRGRREERLVTLSSDVGSAYAAQMKAVLLRSVGASRLVDLSHDLPPHGTLEAAFLLRAMASGFPPGTVHLVVVDPGVGGRRAPLAVACSDGSVLVGPDNGVLMPLARAFGGPRAFRLDPARLGVRRRVGTTFDGRDLFAPAAALLANGAEPGALGTPLSPVESPLPEPRRSARRLAGTVVHVDRCGNVITNLPSAWVPPGVRRLFVEWGRRTRRLPWTLSYDAVAPGEPLALGSSFGTVEIARNRGSASERFGLCVGDPVVVRFGPPRRTTGK